MSLPNTAYGNTVTMTTDGTFDYYQVGGSLTYTFAAGTNINVVYLTITIQTNLLKFKAASQDYIQSLYPVSVQQQLLQIYIASQKAGLSTRTAYVGQLLTWLNGILAYSLSYVNAVSALTDIPTIVATTWDVSQVPVDPAVTVLGALSLNPSPTDPLAATPSTPTRALDTAFQISTSNAYMVFYTISISVTSTLLGSQAGAVELRSDSAATPTTARSKVSNTLSGVAATNTKEAVLCYLVPAGHYVKLVSSGAGTLSITSQTEVKLGVSL
jgi:hypothetical protein